MKLQHRYSFSVGIASILAGILALTCLITGAFAVQFNFEAFSDPSITLLYVEDARLAKWFNLLDMFGYYLLLLPLVLYFHQHFKYKTPWISLITFSGLAYVLIGALGASILAVVWPDLINSYATAAAADKNLISTIFKTITNMVTQGMWNMLEVIFATVWWIGIGNLLYSNSRIIGVITIVAGISTLMDAAGNIAAIPLLAETGLNVYLLAGIIWPVIIGIFIIKKSGRQKGFSPGGEISYTSKKSYQHA